MTAGQYTLGESLSSTLSLGWEHILTGFRINESFLGLPFVSTDIRHDWLTVTEEMKIAHCRRSCKSRSRCLPVPVLLCLFL